MSLNSSFTRIYKKKLLYFKYYTSFKQRLKIVAILCEAQLIIGGSLGLWTSRLSGEEGGRKYTKYNTDM